MTQSSFVTDNFKVAMLWVVGNASGILDGVIGTLSRKNATVGVFVAKVCPKIDAESPGLPIVAIGISGQTGAGRIIRVLV